MQSAIDWEIVHEFPPVASIRQGEAINIHIEGAAENYGDLNNTKLAGSARLTMPDGTDLIPGTRVRVENLALHSIFE